MKAVLFLLGFLLFISVVLCEEVEVLDAENEEVQKMVGEDVEKVLNKVEASEKLEAGEIEQDKPFEAPEPEEGNYWFFDNFQNGMGKWVQSQVRNEDGSPKYNGEPILSSGLGEFVPYTEDQFLLLPSAGRFYGIVAPLEKPASTKDKDLILQYEVKYETALECGGAYLKLPLGEFIDTPESFVDGTTYALMFGPDKCGATNKVHFIFQRKNPLTGEFEEKHLETPPSIKNDALTHVYRIHIKPDSTYILKIDGEVASSGSLFEGMNPSVIPPVEIDDPEDEKPEDWIDDEFMDDPEASKPDDWDEDAPEYIIDENDTKPEDWEDDAPAMVPDPEAEVPEEWDEEEDGEWEAPLVQNPVCVEKGCGKWEPKQIKNPEYKGKWVAPKIKNPEYIGVWAPRKIENPNYFTVDECYEYEEIFGVAVDVWQMTDNVMFDNILLTWDVSVADELEAAWREKFDRENLMMPKTTALDSSGSATEQLLEVLEKIPVPVIGGILLVGFLTILMLFCCRRSQPPVDDEEEVDTKKTDGDNEDESEGESDDESGEEDAPRRRKKKKKMIE